MSSPSRNTLAGARLVGTGNDIEQSGLARTVGTDQAGDGTLGNFKRDVINSPNAAEDTCSGFQP